MMDETNHTVQVIEEHTYHGPGDVSTAHEFLGKLPNGWKLISLVYSSAVTNAGVWTAAVQGPKTVKKS